MKLKNIIKELKEYEGLTRKKGIGAITGILKDVSNLGEVVIGPGDDAAAIKDGDSYLLFAADGMWKKFVESDPYGAGRASVIVNVNDIYAMGGRPIAMVNIISSSKDYDIDALLNGIKDGCALYKTPMAGGHFHPDSDSVELSVAIIGKANKLLTSNSAKPGQDIICAVDLDGTRGKGSIYSWNSINNKNSGQVLSNLDIMVKLAEDELCNTAKDISNPGIPGTLAMLLEASQKGAEVRLEDIPRPDGFDLIDWLKVYPSYGFILCVDKDKCGDTVKLFSNNGITASVIGEVIRDKKIYFNYNDEKGVFFDFLNESVF